MEFGIGPLTEGSSHNSSSDTFAGIIDTARDAEALGFDSVWVGERHFSEDTSAGSSPFVLAGALAQATSDITVGTSVILAPLHHPVRTVEQAGVVDALADGRFICGLGMGYLDKEFETFDVEKPDRVPKLLDTVGMFDRAANRDPFSYDGRVHSVEDIHIQPEFVQSPRPPLWIGGHSESAVRRTARIGDGFISTPGRPLSYIRDRNAILNDELAEQDRDPDKFPRSVILNVFVSDSADESWKTLEPGLRYVQERYVDWIGLDELTDEMWQRAKQSAVYGTPVEVAEQLTEYADVLGEDMHATVHLHYPKVSADKSEAAMELFADEVIPNVP